MDRAKVQRIADNLQIPLYVREDGSVHQFPPGEKVTPDPAMGPQSNAGHGAGPKEG